MTFGKLEPRPETKPQLYGGRQTPAACWHEEMGELFTEHCSMMGFGQFSNLSKVVGRAVGGREALELSLCETLSYMSYRSKMT